MKKKYEILEHTADLKIKACGKSLPQLFSHLLQGMFESISETETRKAFSKKNKSIIERRINIRSSDQESLLVDFLSEALYLSDLNNEVYFEADFDKFEEKELSGIIKGIKIKRFKEEIKAVTYHGLEVKKVNDLWEATVLFDI